MWNYSYGVTMIASSVKLATKICSRATIFKIAILEEPARIGL